MKNSTLYTLGLSLIMAFNVHANVGDIISNRCKVVSFIEKNEVAGAAQYGRNIELSYQTLTTSFDCENSMPVTGGIVIKSPFTLTMSSNLKAEITRLVDSNELFDMTFVDDAYAVKPKRIGDITSFPDPRAQAYRVVGNSTHAYEKEAEYDYLDQVLNATGAIEIPKTAISYKNPNDKRPSWDKTFHFLASAATLK